MILSIKKSTQKERLKRCSSVPQHVVDPTSLAIRLDILSQGRDELTDERVDWGGIGFHSEPAVGLRE